MDSAILIGIIIVLLAIVAFMIGKNSSSIKEDRLEALETRHDVLEQGVMTALKDIYVADKSTHELLKQVMTSQETQLKALVRLMDTKALPAAENKDKEDSA